MNEFRAFHSRWRIALLFLLCLGFVAVGLWLAGVIGEPPNPENWSRRGPRIPPEVLPFFGWFCAAFFGACLPFVAKNAFAHEVQLQIGEHGIMWSKWSEASIPWSEIDRVSVWSFQHQKNIILHLRRPEAFPGRGFAARLASANRMLTGGDISITLVGTDRSFDEAMQAVDYFGGAALRDQ